MIAVLIVALPDWLDPDLLQWIILVVIAVLLYLLYVVMRFVQRAVLKPTGQRAGNDPATRCREEP